MRWISVIALVIMLMACQPEDAVPTNPVTEVDFNVSQATLLKKGVLQGIDHVASGTAHLYDNDGKKFIYFDPFSSQNGPDLKVYLSKDVNASDYIRLGPLKSTMGMQAYAVPVNCDVTQYHYVHIWCEKYTVVFARAEIK
jgi:hypothetical protein